MGFRVSASFGWASSLDLPEGFRADARLRDVSATRGRAHDRLNLESLYGELLLVNQASSYRKMVMGASTARNRR